MACDALPMAIAKRARDSVRRVYGLDFPDDLFAFHDFARSAAELLRGIGIGVDGPLEVLSGAAPRDGWSPYDDWPRFYRDPPEFFTVLVGDTDGLHWGYWFDAPGALPPVVASYFHSDAYQLSVDGTTLFEAVRGEVEELHRAAEEQKEEEPDEADYDRRLATYAEIREELSKYALASRKEIGDAYCEKYVCVSVKPGGRKTVAKTRNDMGIVTPKSAYRALPGKDYFVEKHDYRPKASDVARLVSLAREYAKGGQPGAALKLGHDLWAYPQHADAAREMLALAYDGLDRPTLRSYLDRAFEFRRRCDAARS